MMINFEATESAMHSIQHAKFASRDLWMHHTPVRRQGRIFSGPSETPGSSNMLVEHTLIVRMASTVEALVDKVSMKRMASLVETSSPASAQLLADFELSSSGTWQQRFDCFSSYHGIALKSLPGWQVVDAGIQARNCIAHGLGSLTAQQRGKANLAQQLRIVGIYVGSNAIHLTEPTLRILGDGCLEFVRSLDQALGPN